MVGRTLHRLSALSVSRTKVKGMYADGGGLYLQVTGDGAKSWIYRFSLKGRAREMGLGPLTIVTLSDARSKAAACRALRQEGIDPIENRNSNRQVSAADQARTLTFRECAAAYIAAHESGWRNVKHQAQWRSTLETYAGPIFGDLSVAEIDLTLIMKVLEPVWHAKPETAKRLRGRLEAVLDWATVRGYRRGDNPARWKGHLDHLLPSISKISKPRHHPALPYKELPAFLVDLTARSGTSARALEFLILTGARTGEVLGITWSEVDLDQQVWTVPASRIKAGKEHRVPLSPRATAILLEQQRECDGNFVFPTAGIDKPMSNVALLALLGRMNREGITAHGFRSTFRDWAAEQTAFPREVAEMALAHAIGDKVEAAYRRGDLFDKRRELMTAWARYCAADPE